MHVQCWQSHGASAKQIEHQCLLNLEREALYAINLERVGSPAIARM